ncbi:MAG: hypothetical protein JJT75_06030 [Opitutales bacterium]|nr:hypothetical protein [Opitutales bacterium]MCH8540703.1 hypothetical protein [Opitutales bacterium]
MQVRKFTRPSTSLFFAVMLLLAASVSSALADDEGESGDGEDHGSVIQIS